MRLRRLFAVASPLLIIAAALFACGDDDNTVRPRLDSGLDATSSNEGGEAGPNTLPCGATIPATYESVSFATNAAVELALKASFLQLDGTMKSTEGASSTVVTAGGLQAIFSGGTPSLRAVSTAPTQALVDGYLSAYGDAVGKTWTPAAAEQDGSVVTGGKYDATYHFGATGIDLRQAATKTLLTGAFYNHVLGIIAAPITDASVDRLLAAYGASLRLANRTDPDAGADADELVSAYASQRDDKGSAIPGPYRKIKTALLTMKAATAAGDKCKAELDAAVGLFLREWEKTLYASAIFYLNDAATKATVAPIDGPGALHSFAQAFGFIQSMKGIPAEKRKIKDDQIDALLVKIGAPTPYRLVTNPSERILKMAESINDIALIFGFSAADVESFKKSF